MTIEPYKTSTGEDIEIKEIVKDLGVLATNDLMFREPRGKLGCRFMDRSGFRNHRTEENRIISQVNFTNLENPLQSEFTNAFNHVAGLDCL